ncbi:MAG TPA: GGDEF domain-containing protein [Pirellulales bacterium]|jgi:diguanylate cyclase
MEAAFDPETMGATGSAAIVVIALVAAVFELLLGIAVGWWLRSGKKVAAEPAMPSADLEHAQASLHHAEHALTNLRELATQVQADVGAHSSHVEAISNELNANSGSAAEGEVNVMAAVTKILEANRRLEQQLHTAENKLEQQAEQIRFHAANALTDALTGLGNRRAFDTELNRRIAEFQRHGTPFCLMMLDVDHFKKFNDTHGHLAGDEVLRMVGRTLKAAVRTPDFVARYGGEEFGVIMPQTAMGETSGCAERVRAAIELAECTFEGKQLSVTASLGVAQIGSGQSPALMVQCADEALYAAKQAGRNQVQYHGSSCMIKPADAAKQSIESAKQPTEPTAGETKPTAAGATPPVEDAVDADDRRTDLQTGLPNRTAFCEEIRRRLAEVQRHGNRLSLMLVKVDDLDMLMHGHGGNLADLVLRTCTQFLTAAMREMDMVARYDQDVFGIVLPGTALIHATGASERLRVAIEHCPLKVGAKDVRFTISAGLAEAQPGEDFMTFLSRAADAKNTAQGSGGNKVRFHTGISIDSLPEPVAAAKT